MTKMSKHKLIVDPVSDLQVKEHRKVKCRKVTFEEVFKDWNSSQEIQNPWGGEATTLCGTEKSIWG